MFVKRNRSNLIFLFFVWALFFAGIFVYSAKNVYADVIIVDSNITVDTTWVTGNVYVIENDVSILTGISLFIEPGVIIKLKDDASLLVDGNLQAIGTANEQIFFTSWYDDSNDDSLIEYAVIRYAGSINDWDCCPAGDVIVSAIEILDASPTIRNSFVGQNRGTGIEVSTSIPGFPAEPNIDNNTISGNRSYAIQIDAHTHPQVSGNTLTANVGNGLAIEAGTMQASAIWDQTDTEYIVIGDIAVASSAQLTIAPGMIIKLKDDASLLVDGNLQAIGTANEQIFFTSWYDDSIP